ncbi:Omp85 superfamily domain [Popillia japonica]|uniref:Omp85 superfamily domain n=1 Tax=Popillia japonica TaxID=7064 RepID=A0AAW1MG49_POPJA
MGTVYAKEKHKSIAGLPQPEINYDECKESKYIPLDAPVWVDYISVDGIARTHDDIVADATRDLFKPQNFRNVLFNAHKARLRLQSLGCFRNVSVHIDISHGPTATPEGVEVTFYVPELKRFIDSVNTEVEHIEGSVVVGLRAPNTFVNTEVEHIEGSVVVGLRAPNTFGRGERVFVEYSYGSRRSNNFTIGVMRPFAGVHEENHILTIDLRDDRIFPSCGFLAEWTIELAGLGGDVRLLKNDIYLQSILSVAKNVTLQGTLGAGFLKGLSNDMKIGITDKFFLGGPLDIRGFRMRGIGPRSDGNALGEDVY